MPKSRTQLLVVTGIVVAAALTGCASGPSPMPVPSASSTPAGDGVLRIGAVFPSTGSASYLGPAQAVGVALAAADINAAGGVLGKPVEVLVRDSGDITTGTIEASFADLQSKSVDVVVGPSSSALTERILPKTAAAKVPLITPASSSVRLSALGATGYLYRTVPSAALQGTVLGATIGAGTKPPVALVYFDDDNGKAIRASLDASLTKSGGKLVAAEPIATAANDPAAAVAAVVKAAPVAVVIASPFSANDLNKKLITQLSAAGLGGAKLWLTNENMADYSQALPAGTLTGVNGILEGIAPTDAFAARLKAADGTVSNLLYAAEAYDATILAALAASAAKDDSGAAIARGLRAVSAGGIKCTTFAECVTVLKTRSNIDYDGLTGDIAFDAKGDPHPAHYGLYRYDAGNRFARVGELVGG